MFKLIKKMLKRNDERKNVLEQQIQIFLIQVIQNHLIYICCVISEKYF